MQVWQSPAQQPASIWTPCSAAKSSRELAEAAQTASFPDRLKVLRELRRLLKKGGTLLLTTPNLLSLRARLAYAFVGQPTFRSWIDEHASVQAQDGDRNYHGHAFLVDYFELRYSLHLCGFRIRHVLPARWGAWNLFLLPIAPLVWFFTRRAARWGRKRFLAAQREGRVPSDVAPPGDEMVRHLVSLPMLLNRSIFFEAEAV